MGNNKMKRQHQHNFLFFLFFLRSIRKFSVRGPFYSISWLQIIIFLLFVSIPIGGAPSLLFGPCHAAMYEIIDCSQIFHVISKIKSSNYRAHAYFSIHPEKKNWAKRTTEITLWKLEWILMGRNLRASVSVVLPKLQQLNLSPMRSQYLSAKCQFINCYVCWGAINIKSHRCDITAEQSSTGRNRSNISLRAIEEHLFGFYRRYSQLTSNINHNLDVYTFSGKISQFLNI